MTRVSSLDTYKLKVVSRKLLIPDAQVTMQVTANFPNADAAKQWIVQQPRLLGSYELTITHRGRQNVIPIRMVQ